MSVKGYSRVFWCGLVIMFLLALLPRLVYPVSRPMQWYKRSVRFWDALLTGDLAGTYQRSHPGVTTMWVAGLGLRVYAAVHGWSSKELLDPLVVTSGIKYYPVEAGVAALSIVISLCVCLACVLLSRLLGWRAGIVGGCLLALDPFYVAYSKVLHVDALVATLMLVSALFLICYLQERRGLHLFLSGVFAGLAFLTKSTSGFLAPYAVLAVVYYRLMDKRHTAVGSSKMRGWGRWLWEVARDCFCTLGLWGLVAACVFVLLWPAMWVMPGEALFQIAERTLFHAETAHRNPKFFAGQVILGDVGPFFYPATIAWKTTLVTLPALCAAVLFLLWRAKRGSGVTPPGSGSADKPVWWMLVYACGFTGAMTLAARKELRYLLPTFPALDVLAAWGLVQVASAIGGWERVRKLTWVPSAIVVMALVAQAGTVLRHHPYYGTHHNLLLGGSRVAQHMLPLGDQGEGLDLAARFINGYPGAEWMTAGVQPRFVSLFERYFVGYTYPIGQSDADYWLFTVNLNQREHHIEHWGEYWEACQQMEPLRSVSFDGVPYAWIYRAYPHEPEGFPIEQRLGVQLGDHIRLLGYRLSESGLSAGDTLTVTLFWQSDGRLAEDDHVFVHLLDTEGLLVAQHDGVPVRGERPTWSWRDTEVLQDEHVLITDVSLPGGTYALSVGMYDFMTGVRLPAVRPTSERVSEDRVLLGNVRVTLP
jgi:hypothetical protein